MEKKPRRGKRSTEVLVNKGILKIASTKANNTIAKGILSAFRISFFLFFILKTTNKCKGEIRQSN
mgnify:CR=1 FL=1